MRFWQAIATATLAADFVRTNSHDWPIWLHCLANAGDMLIVGLVWLVLKWVFSENLPAASAHPGPAIRANAKEAGALDEVSK